LAEYSAAGSSGGKRVHLAVMRSQRNNLDVEMKYPLMPNVEAGRTASPESLNAWLPKASSRSVR